MFSRVNPTHIPADARQRVFSRTTKTSVRDFCDISYPLAGPDRSHQATTERRIGRKPRKFRDKFESIQSPAKTFYNNDLSVAEGEGFEPPVRVYPVQRFSKPPPSTTRPPLRLGAGERPALRYRVQGVEKRGRGKGPQTGKRKLSGTKKLATQKGRLGPLLLCTKRKENQAATGDISRSAFAGAGAR